jgi:hypothetical protein
MRGRCYGVCILGLSLRAKVTSERLEKKGPNQRHNTVALSKSHGIQTYKTATNRQSASDQINRGGDQCEYTR